MVMVVRLSIMRHQPARIWRDNATVVRRMQKMLRGHFVCRLTMPDHDLWEVLHSLLVNAPVQIQIFQVASHLR